jgi:hypothetical protein
VSSTAPQRQAAPETGVDLVRRMLVAAHELVREGWCQGAAARDASGRPISPSSAFANAWSAPGALERAWSREQDRLGFRLGLKVFQRANLAVAAAAGDVPQAWNDVRGRTHEEVLAVLAAAIDDVDGRGQTVRNPAKVDSATH